MCYAIPAKVVEIKNETIGVLDYFGERRNVLLDLEDVRVGDYIYAQGGIMVRKIPEEDALEILETWKGVFFELKRTDLALSRLDEKKISSDGQAVLQKVNLRKNLTKEELLSLYKLEDDTELPVLNEIANNVRQREHGNSSCIHGIIEFSNYCGKSCLYCGIRKEKNIQRYRMSVDEIVDAAFEASDRYGFKTLVLQSGEDLWYSERKLTEIVIRIRALGILVFLSIGSRSFDTYKKLYAAGARGVLMRFETSNKKNFSDLRPGEELAARLDLIKSLKRLGYIIATGFIAGLPDETNEDLVNSILTTKFLGSDMYSFGPLIPTSGTPLQNSPPVDPKLLLKTIAVARLADSNANILVTTALETLSPGLPEKALLAGANSMMINVTPSKQKQLYSIYSNRAGTDKTVPQSINHSVGLLMKLGRAPTDLGNVRGHIEKNFIDEKKINDILKDSQKPSALKIREIISKAGDLKGLSIEEAACLIQCEDKTLNGEILKTAGFIKEKIYGNRLVMFAPLYITNHCINNCSYCGFKKENKITPRKRLKISEIIKEVEAMEDAGHKRLLLVAGEDPEISDIGFLEKVIKSIYSIKRGKGAIRRININVAPLKIDDFRRLHNAGIGTYQLFQETYHFDTYKKNHPNGPKSDYISRLYAMDNAQNAGIDDIGIGALFGLYDYKFELLALLRHAQHLEETFGVGPHTISVPRIKPAPYSPLSRNAPYPVSDKNFKKLVAVLRLAVPYTGIILSTRESGRLRDELIEAGVSQVSAGSKTVPGSYHENSDATGFGQFETDDNRSQLEVVTTMVKKGFIPSFCTACYRTGRTGKDFMGLAKPGDIKNFCAPNSLFTFMEYIIDYGNDELKKIAAPVIDKAVDALPDKTLQKKTRLKLLEIEKGKRDLYF